MPFVMLATTVAGLWSLAAGRLILDAAALIVGS